nr:MAG TPA: hypothetical protein [Caudoviricetes sp.]
MLLSRLVKPVSIQLTLLFPNLNSLNSVYWLVERRITRLTPLGIPLYT